jgi:hypothetical protein
VNARLERQAVNEAHYREVNERLAALDKDAVAGWADAAEELDFMCECGVEGGCAQRVRMTLAEYEGVRAQDDRFALVPGHETPELERVVERTDRYVVVDKIADAEPFVADDPRRAQSR